MALSSHIVFKNHPALESAAPAHKNLSLPKAGVDDLENGDGNGGYFSCSRLGLSGPGDNGALLNGAGLLEPIGRMIRSNIYGIKYMIDFSELHLNPADKEIIRCSRLRKPIIYFIL